MRLFRGLGRPVLAALGASAGITVLVRAIGLGSQGLATSRFGASAALDGYFIALLLPAILVTPLAAAVETSVAPVYASLIATEPAAAPTFRRLLMRRTVVAGAVLSVAALVAVPVLVFLTSPGASAEQHRIAERAALFVYPSILPQLVTAAGSAILFGQGRFQAPILVSAVNPLCVIAALVLVGSARIDVLAGAVLLGYVLEALAIALLVRSHRLPQDAAAVGALGEALAGLRPLILTYALLRAVPLVDQMFASALTPGSLTRFALAAKFFEVATAVLIIPNARMATTRLADVAARRADLLRAVQAESLRAWAVGGISALAFLVTAPAAVLLVYRHGEFSNEDAWATIRIAWTFAVALVPLGLAFLLQRVFLLVGVRSAMPVLAGLEVITNLVLDACLAPFFGAVGIAAATVITYFLLVGAGGLVVRSRIRAIGARP